jgi:hypothetical protein
LQHCGANVILVDTGNQAGKTSNIVKSYVERILGHHPIEKRNMRPNSPIRTIRFASEKLPIDSDEGGEIQNTVYPAFKKLFPAYLIKKDITATAGLRKRSEFGTMIRSRSYFIEAVAGSEEQSGGFGRQAFRQGTGERFDPEGTQEP